MGEEQRNIEAEAGAMEGEFDFGGDGCDGLCDGFEPKRPLLPSHGGNDEPGKP
jgi:hypothetical protein